MQVVCKSTNGHAEMHCCVCGLGFVMFWERQSRSERVDATKEIQDTLRNQHRNQKGPEAHPAGTFLVPQWNPPYLGWEESVEDKEPSLAL